MGACFGKASKNNPGTPVSTQSVYRGTNKPVAKGVMSLVQEAADGNELHILMPNEDSDSEFPASTANGNKPHPNYVRQCSFESAKDPASQGRT